MRRILTAIAGILALYLRRVTAHLTAKYPPRSFPQFSGRKATQRFFGAGRNQREFADKFEPDDQIQQLFFPFCQYIDELLGVHDMAVIIADHKERQCVLMKRNRDRLDVMKLDYEHSIIREIHDFGLETGAGSPHHCSVDPGHETARAADMPNAGPEYPAPADLDPGDGGDASRELRLINDLYRIAVNKYSHNMQLKKLSEIDDLTGLSNHRHFQEQLEKEIGLAQRLGRPLSIIFLDIDHFKIVNDTYGHQTGDLALRELAAVARGKLRETDQIARYGGEEFAVILPGTGKSRASEVAERLREAVQSHNFVSDDNSYFTITVSMGVSDMSDCAGRHELIEAADKALYRAKRAGRNRVMS